MMHPATRPATSMPDTSSGRSMPNGGGPPRCTGRPVPSTSRRCAATSTPSRNAEHEPTKAGDGRVGLYAGFCPRAPRGLPMGGHPSRPAVAGRLQRSTRRLGRAALERLRRTAANRASLLTLLRVGFTEPPRSPGVLVVSYTTVSPLPPARERLAVCSLWHCPAGHPGLLLTTTLPCGARTFLGDGVSPPTRPPSRLVRRARQSSAAVDHRQGARRHADRRRVRVHADDDRLERRVASAPVEPEADTPPAVLGRRRHVDDLPCLLLDRVLGEQLQVPAVLGQRRDRLLHWSLTSTSCGGSGISLHGDVLDARPPRLGQVGEDPLVAGVRDGVQHALAERPVVGGVHVARRHPGRGPGRAEVPGDDELGPVPPDRRGEVAPQLRARRPGCRPGGRGTPPRSRRRRRPTGAPPPRAAARPPPAARRPSRPRRAWPAGSGPPCRPPSRRRRRPRCRTRCRRGAPRRPGRAASRRAWAWSA